MSLAEPTLITIRESLEAFLLVSIFAGLVAKLGHKEARKYLLWGAASAVGVSIIVGALVNVTIAELFEETGSEAVWAGVAALIAVVILTYMVIWMYRHTIELVAGMRGRAQEALAAGRPGLLFTIAFVAVAREGLETVFFFASLVPSTPLVTLLVALLLGLAISGALAFLVFSGIVRMSIKKFYTITGLLLILFAAGLLVVAVGELTEVGWLPATRTAWDTSGVLSESSAFGSFVHAVTGYTDAPSVAQAAAYFLYVFGVGTWYLWGVLGRKFRRHATPAAVAAPTEA